MPDTASRARSLRPRTAFAPQPPIGEGGAVTTDPSPRRRPPILLAVLAVVFTVIGVVQLNRALATGEAVPTVVGSLQIACGLALTFLYVRDLRRGRGGGGAG